MDELRARSTRALAAQQASFGGSAHNAIETALRRAIASNLQGAALLRVIVQCTRYVAQMGGDSLDEEAKVPIPWLPKVQQTIRTYSKFTSIISVPRSDAESVCTEAQHSVISRALLERGRHPFVTPLE